MDENILQLSKDPEFHKEINNLHKEIKTLAVHIADEKNAISDVLDDKGHQYVDLVMEGGGMLGIALVGYSWALEEMGVRFMGLGGTSAGSINALLMAAMDKPDAAKSPKLLKELTSMDFYQFVDGGKNARALIDLGFKKDKSLFDIACIIFHTLRVKNKLYTNYGLNEGEKFLEWLKNFLSSVNINTLSDLQQQLGHSPTGLRKRGCAPYEADEEKPEGKLAIISTDITTETKAEFPRMAKLYWKKTASVHPAEFARASMAIPFFFEPFRVADVPQGKLAEDNWRELVGYDVTNDPTAKIPSTAMFVDGGMISNFPIDAFHNRMKVPAMPTFGVKLEYDKRYKPVSHLPVRSKGNKGALLPFVGALFNSSRHALDYDFIKKNSDFQHLVQYIPCTYQDGNGTKSYNWLDFNMSPEHKAGLFKQGAEKAVEFVREFSSPVDGKGKPAAPDKASFNTKWAYYKHLRSILLAVS